MNRPAGHGQNGIMRMSLPANSGKALQATNCQNTAIPIAMTVKAESVLARNRGVASGEPISGSALPTRLHGRDTANHVAHNQIQKAGDSRKPVRHAPHTSVP